ncbi:DNA polymerase [Rudaeicoccus suwonensis]|uniref:DNA-directed DNA polymerase n=1 Tax=Rudaeicoccus suwonensis TaxID=657409 RepID=A0A561ECD9_9MICO|nr:DNA polymerase [Rudaeicoccus suwonensis]TWE13274.1 DNA polymerase-1 [Rudaeicoccus suwonensis]
MRGSLHAVVFDRSGRTGAIATDGSPTRTGPTSLILDAVRQLEAESEPPRWVIWNGAALTTLVTAGIRPRRVWDLSQAHLLWVGGSTASTQVVWAVARGLDTATIPAPRRGDLFDLSAPGSDGDDDLLDAAGHLNPAAIDDGWPTTAHLGGFAELAVVAARAQQDLLAERPHAVSTAASESGAALLCAELGHDGLPVDRTVMEGLITEAVGPRPTNEADAARMRRERDAQVLDLAPGRPGVDLRNPAHVREFLRSLGVQVDDTRAWNLEPYRGAHPAVAALLEWRKAERIATTYGWNWLDAHVGKDGRLRGPWTPCDGGAGRMTAGAGLHSLPIALRPGIAADTGHVLVRADLGQVEPRVLAVVSGDSALAAATAADDLYATVAAQLHVDRQAAKIAVLAAMYGQTSGTAADALRRMDRAYPQAMAYLRAAAERGQTGQSVITYGGRLVRVATADDPARQRALGRFTRNAVVQGAAAEFFKAWALTVRDALRPLDAHIVLCLHDELLVHAPQQHAEATARVVTDALAAAAHHWSGGAPVRFVADTRVIHRWSEAKD